MTKPDLKSSNYNGDDDDEGEDRDIDPTPSQGGERRTPPQGGGCQNNEIIQLIIIPKQNVNVEYLKPISGTIKVKLPPEINPSETVHKHMEQRDVPHPVVLDYPADRH